MKVGTRNHLCSNGPYYCSPKIKDATGWMHSNYLAVTIHIYTHTSIQDWLYASLIRGWLDDTFVHGPTISKAPLQTPSLPLKMEVAARNNSLPAFQQACSNLHPSFLTKTKYLLFERSVACFFQFNTNGSMIRISSRKLSHPTALFKPSSIHRIQGEK
jgi:hypothetical protein